GGFDSAYAKGRIPTEGKMSRHIQFESNMSLTGANADKRVPLTPTQQKKALAKLYSYVTGNAVTVADFPEHLDAEIQKAASQLKKAGSNAVVVTGIQDINAQTLVFAINEFLNSKAFDPKTPIKIRQGNDKAVAGIVEDMKAGKVGTLIMSGVNTLYTLPNAADFAEGLKNTELSLTFSMKMDETASATQYAAAAPHYLESWGDMEPVKGSYALMQPTIRPLFNTKQFQEALLTWTGNTISYHEYIKNTWTAEILGGNSFSQALHDGVFEGNQAKGTSEAKEEKTFVGGIIEDVAEGLGIKSKDEDKSATSSGTVTAAEASRMLATASSNGLELVLYTKTGMGDGQQANNPWLQECPDPITRTSWDNYLTVSKADAE